MEWIITRPERDARRTAEQLIAAGVRVRCHPLISRVALPWPSIDPSGSLLVLLSSAFVSRAVLAEWPALFEPGREVRVAALAGETAHAAAVRVDHSAHGGIERLVESLRRRGVRASRVHYPTSRQALDRPEHRAAVSACEQTIGPVSVHAVYDIVTLPPPRPEAIPHGAGWVFHSPTAVDALAPVAASLPQPSVVLCHGRSTLRGAQRALPRHWPTPELVSDAESLIARCRQLQPLHPKELS